MTAKQLELPMTLRGQRLRLLRRIRLPRIVHESSRLRRRETEGDVFRVADGDNVPPTSPATMLVVLKEIDDICGQNDAWRVSVPRLMECTGLSERTVQRAVAALQIIGVLHVDDRFCDGLQTVCEYRIIWSHVEDYLPEQREQKRAEITHRLRPVTVTPRPRHSDTPAPSQRRPGPVTVTPRPRHSDTRTAQSPAQRPAPLSAPSPPTSDGEGKLMWQGLVQEPLLLTAAVKRRDSDWLHKLWLEAVAAGWQTDTRDGYWRFLAACYYVVRPPAGFTIENPARVLRSKCIDNEWTTGRFGDGADEQFASDMRRLTERGAEPRTSSFDAKPTDPGVELATQIAALRRHVSRAGVLPPGGG